MTQSSGVARPEDLPQAGPLGAPPVFCLKGALRTAMSLCKGEKI